MVHESIQKVGNNRINERNDLTHEEEHYHYALEPTLSLWYNNINKLSSEEKTNHIRTLELSTRFLRRNMDEVLKNIGLSTLVFEK